jgi:hypothetical protein
MLIINFLLSILIYIKCKGVEKEPEHPILNLTPMSYRQYTTTQPHFFLLFHNPWCKWSQNLEHKLTKIHEILKLEKQPFYIGKIDTTLYDIPELISQHIPAHLLNPTITYPKLVYYNNGQPLEVHNNRPDKDALLTFIKRKLHPGAVRITNTYAFLDKLATDSKAFVLLSNDANAVWTFDELASTYKDYMFYIVEDETIVEKDHENEIRLYNFGTEKAKSKINSDNFHVDIETFIKKHTFKNYFTKFNEELVNEIFMKQKTAIILFRNEYENKTMYLEQVIPMLAQQEKDLTWIVTDLSGKHELKLAKLMSVNFDTLPTLRILDFSTGFKRYELGGTLSTDGVLDFIRLFKKGDLSPYYSSQREDVNNKKALVRKLTSGTFYENVIILKKNILVLFHTNWCGHCKKVLVY